MVKTEQALSAELAKLQQARNFVDSGLQKVIDKRIAELKKLLGRDQKK